MNTSVLNAYNNAGKSTLSWSCPKNTPLAPISLLPSATDDLHGACDISRFPGLPLKAFRISYTTQISPPHFSQKCLPNLSPGSSAVCVELCVCADKGVWLSVSMVCAHLCDTCTTVCLVLCVQLRVHLVICVSVQTKVKGLCVYTCVCLHVHLNFCLPQASFFLFLTNKHVHATTLHPGKTQGHRLSSVPPWEWAWRTGRLIVHQHLRPGSNTRVQPPCLSAGL